MDSAGIFVGITVEPIGKNRQFFDQFRGISTGELVDNTHISAQYPEELAQRGLALWEIKKLAEVAGNIITRLGELKLVNEPIKVDPEKGVSGRKKWWTLVVAEAYEHQIDLVRGAASSAVEEGMGIKLAAYSPEGYHISLARRQSQGHDRLKTRIPPPLNWKITGFDVGVHEARPGYRTKVRPSYVNKPAARF